MPPSNRDAPVKSEPFLGPLSGAARAAGSASLTTVLVAFAANFLVAVAKSVAAVVTGSASILAEAAHSWADTGNEVFLLIAYRRSRRPPDRAHPLGYGREAYVWSLLAALGLFVAGGAVSVTHGVQELMRPAPATDYVVGYVVIAFSFVVEGISLCALSGKLGQRLLRWSGISGAVFATSDPTLRAVFAEDSAGSSDWHRSRRTGRPPADGLFHPRCRRSHSRRRPARGVATFLIDRIASS